MPAAQKRCFCAVASDSVHRHSLRLCQEISLVDNIFISAQCEFKENEAMMMMMMMMMMTITMTMTMTMRTTMTVMMIMMMMMMTMMVMMMMITMLYDASND